MKQKTTLLWIDGLGGLTVGIPVLCFHAWLSGLYGVTPGAVIMIGIANLMYGSYSTSLVLRSQRPKKLIVLLIGANLTWTLVCLVLSIWFRDTITLFGLIFIIGEGIYVGGLGCFEWRWREFLSTS